MSLDWPAEPSSFLRRFLHAVMVFLQPMLKTKCATTTLAVVFVELCQSFLALQAFHLFWSGGGSLAKLGFMYCEILFRSLGEIHFDGGFTERAQQYLLKMQISSLAVMRLSSVMVGAKWSFAVLAMNRHPVDLAAVLQTASESEFVVFHRSENFQNLIIFCKNGTYNFGNNSRSDNRLKKQPEILVQNSHNQSEEERTNGRSYASVSINQEFIFPNVVDQEQLLDFLVGATRFFVLILFTSVITHIPLFSGEHNSYIRKHSYKPIDFGLAYQSKYLVKMEADGDDSKYMIIFKGRIHFNPSTLNNLYLAYFLADSFQKDPHY